jgi:hypothetical protein
MILLTETELIMSRIWTLAWASVAVAVVLVTAAALIPQRIDRTELGDGWQCRGNMFSTTCAKTVDRNSADSVAFIA